jgi:hypothetical protein
MFLDSQNMIEDQHRLNTIFYKIWKKIKVLFQTRAKDKLNELKVEINQDKKVSIKIVELISNHLKL